MTASGNGGKTCGIYNHATIDDPGKYDGSTGKITVCCRMIAKKIHFLKPKQASSIDHNFCSFECSFAFVYGCVCNTNGQFSVEFPRGIMSALSNYISHSEMSFFLFFSFFTLFGWKWNEENFKLNWKNMKYGKCFLLLCS